MDAQDPRLRPDYFAFQAKPNTNQARQYAHAGSRLISHDSTHGLNAELPDETR